MNIYTKQELMSAIRFEVEKASAEIIKTQNHDTMLYRYWGVSYFLDAMQYGLLGITEENNEFFKEMNDKIKIAHSNYYEKAEQDFENAHKRLF